MNGVHKQFAGVFHIKLMCLLFWGAWFFIASLSNLFDFIGALYGLPINWHFHSGNYLALAQVLQIYNTPTIILNILFIIDTLVQMLSAILFSIAALYFYRFRQISLIVNAALGVSMALWASFLLLEEIFIAYSFEHVHIRLLVFEMITLLMMHLLP